MKIKKNGIIIVDDQEIIQSLWDHSSFSFFFFYTSFFLLACHWNESKWLNYYKWTIELRFSGKWWEAWNSGDYKRERIEDGIQNSAIEPRIQNTKCSLSKGRAHKPNSILTLAIEISYNYIQQSTSGKPALAYRTLETNTIPHLISFPFMCLPLDFLAHFLGPLPHITCHVLHAPLCLVQALRHGPGSLLDVASNPGERPEPCQP